MATVLIPGSFDPLHLGHLDVVDQAVELFGDVVIGVLVNFEKPTGLFDPDERVSLAEQSVADHSTVQVRAFGGLAVDAASDVSADFIVKGLRSATDYDIEQQMAQMNQSVTGIRTVFLPCRSDYGYVSSRFIREIASHGGQVAHLVPPAVAAALADRFESSSDASRN
jgi:pantetheine-phosphate adenylyltransferase